MARVWAATLIVICCGAGCAVTAGTQGAQGVRDAKELPSLREALISHRRALLITNVDCGRMGAQSARWFEPFLLGLDKADHAVTGDEWQEALCVTVALGKKSHLFYQDTGYVTEGFAIGVLIAALGDSHENVREIAVRVLAHECRQTDLERHAGAILRSLKVVRTHDEWLLYGKLPLGKEDREALAKNERAPQEVRARAGDKKSERALVSEFRKAVKASTMRHLAEQLGYVGSRNCVEALVEGLKSEVSEPDSADSAVALDVSIRGDILLALGQVFQTEPLFTLDARFLRTTRGDAFEKHRGLSEYLRDVDDWTMKHYHLRAWGEKPPWFVRSLQTR